MDDATTSCIAKLQKNPEHQRLSILVQQKKKELDRARSGGTIEDRLRISAEYNINRKALENIETTAIANDPAVTAAKAAAKMKKEEDDAKAAAEESDLKTEQGKAALEAKLAYESSPQAKIDRAVVSGKLIEGMSLSDSERAIHNEFERIANVDEGAKLNTHLSKTSDAVDLQGYRVTHWEIRTYAQYFYIQATFNPDGHLTRSSEITQNYFDSP